MMRFSPATPSSTVDPMNRRSVQWPYIQGCSGSRSPLSHVLTPEPMIPSLARISATVVSGVTWGAPAACAGISSAAASIARAAPAQSLFWILPVIVIRSTFLSCHLSASRRRSFFYCTLQRAPCQNIYKTVALCFGAKSAILLLCPLILVAKEEVLFMWTRKLLKTNAKHVLSRSYWQVFLACLITSLLCGTIELRYNVGSNSASSLPQEAAQLASNQGFPYSLLLPYLFTLGTLAILLFLFAALCWTILVSPAIQVGLNRYLLFNRTAPARLGMLFSSFTYGYWNTVWVMFLLNLKIVLWSLLLIVPGIVKSYQYRFVGWLLAENPGMDASRAFEISTMMTDGEKWNIFVLDLSFLGWNLLGSLLLGIGVLFVQPYTSTTNAELYAAMRAKVIASGYVTEAELQGAPIDF
ncbi:hypothetical protein B5E66_00670 [Faecalibacterium sp. An121]|nr:hypothetical protein B5E66_00670 [Faecalibacterium sp. An121]